MRKVYVDVTVQLIIRADEGVSIFEVIDECDYDFKSTLPGADIEGTEIKGIEIVGSK